MAPPYLIRSPVEGTLGLVQTPVLIGIAMVLVLVLVRRLAARRVRAGDGRYVWLMFVPTVAGSVVILWGAIEISSTSPIVGLLLAGGGLLYFGALMRFLVRTQRSVRASLPGQDVSVALTEPLIDFTSTAIGLMLIGGLVAVVGLVIWGITQAGG